MALFLFKMNKYPIFIMYQIIIGGNTNVSLLQQKWSK